DLLSLKQAAETLSLTSPTLQRHLRALEAKGLLIKSRQKITRCQVATFYQVAPSVWPTMAQTAHITLRQPAKIGSLAHKLSANHGPATAIKAIPKADQEVVNFGGNRPKPSLPQEDEKFVHPKDEEIVHRNKNINKININKNNMTACGQPNVLRETCEDNEQKSDAILKNEEILPPTTLPLGKRLGKKEGLSLETNLLQTPTLNARQRRYVQG
ncbi:MAG: hypothetical protein GY782_07220, partial [Gammaproteobacteria bacterium]|nr:hypothetical protein [Gammaproteobacteria bacterium]